MKNPFQVVVVDPKSNELAAELGISDERGEELMDLLEKQLQEQFLSPKTGDIVVALEKATESCSSANEVAFVGYILGDAMSRFQSHPLFDLL